MKKNKMTVPVGIRYMSEWKDFIIPDYPCIMDKKIPGCGFTEYCITNSEDIILCSPRKILLSNKEEQHPGEILYCPDRVGFRTERQELHPDDDPGREDP